MSTLTQLVVFRLGEQRYATALGGSERVIPAVEVTALPGAPAIVLGVIDVAGEIVPVFDLRRRFGLTARAIVPADQFLIACKSGQRVALVIEEVFGVIDYPAAEIVTAASIVPGIGQIQGLLKLPDGLVLMHDLEKLLSFEETLVLQEALNQEARHDA